MKCPYCHEIITYNSLSSLNALTCYSNVNKHYFYYVNKDRFLLVVTKYNKKFVAGKVANGNACLGMGDTLSDIKQFIDGKTLLPIPENFNVSTVVQHINQLIDKYQTLLSFT